MFKLCTYILVFLFLYSVPLVEWYMDDIDESYGIAAVFGVRCFILVPSLYHSLPVILREEVSCHLTWYRGETVTSDASKGRDDTLSKCGFCKNFSTLYLKNFLTKLTISEKC